MSHIPPGHRTKMNALCTLNEPPMSRGTVCIDNRQK